MSPSPHPGASPPGPDLPTPWFLALVGAVGLVALLLRVVDLTGIPPGLHFDQAANGLLALQILGGQRPVFFPSYTGREALFMYVVAGFFALLGPGVLGLRLAGALCGVATVIGMAFLGASLFDRRTGLIAATWLAGLYWHLHVSRLGERTIMVPLLDTFALLALWEGFRRRSLPLVFLGGALAGLQLDTYPSSRFFLPVLLAIGLADLIDQAWRRRAASSPASVASAAPTSEAGTLARCVLVAVLGAGLAASPLAWYFRAHPGDFLGRADQVAIWNAGPTAAAVLAAFLTSTERTLGMFVLQGDLDWKYNLAGRPVFDPVSAAGFLLGIATLLARWRDRAARATLIWWLGMLVPGFLSVDAPQFMRTLGAAPPAVLLAARGLETVTRWLARRRGFWGRLAPALRAWPLLAGALAAYQYFAVWAPSPAAYLALEGDVTAAATIIQAQAPAYPTVYVASRYGPDPTISFLAGGAFGRLRWFDGRAALPLPPPGSGPTLYVLPRTAVDPYWYLRIPAADRVAATTAPDTGPGVEAFVLRPGITLADPREATVGRQVPGIAELLTADVPPTTPAGAPIYPTFRWQLTARPAAPLKFFVHLVDRAGQTWAQYDEEVYPTAEWRDGQQLLVRQPLAVPDDTPPGSYVLQAGLERTDGAPLALQLPNGQPAGTFWTSGDLTVTRPAQPPSLDRLPIAQRLDQLFGGTVRLVGATVGVATAQDGDTVPLTLVWQVVRPPGPGLTVVLQAQNRAGQVVAQAVRPPTAGVWPSADWRPGDVVVDRQSLLIPAGTAAGPLILSVGLRDGAGQPLTAASPASAAVPVGGLALRQRPRPVVRVTIAHPQAVAFADGIRLLGYDLTTATTTPGATLRLTLYWQADRPVTRSWTVFTHLLDDGNQVLAQHDGVPAGGQRPTTTWAPGETIVDPHVLLVQADAPAGTDRLEVGLYDASTGQRLPTAAGADRVLLSLPVRVAAP